MDIHRITPQFEKPDLPAPLKPNTKDSPLGCIWTILVFVIGYYVVSAISRVNSHTGNRLDQIICYGTLLCVVFMFVLGDLQQKKKNKKLQEERRQWKNTCVFSDVAIVSRRHSPGGANDDGYEIHYYKPYYHLDLEMSSDQRAIAPNQTVVSIDVNRSTYEKLEKRDTVRIYYKPESPLTFLLEEEI